MFSKVLYDTETFDTHELMRSYFIYDGIDEVIVDFDIRSLDDHPPMMYACNHIKDGESTIRVAYRKYEQQFPEQADENDPLINAHMNQSIMNTANEIAESIISFRKEHPTYIVTPIKDRYVYRLKAPDDELSIIQVKDTLRKDGEITLIGNGAYRYRDELGRLSIDYANGEQKITAKQVVRVYDKDGTVWVDAIPEKHHERR